MLISVSYTVYFILYFAFILSYFAYFFYFFVACYLHFVIVHKQIYTYAKQNVKSMSLYFCMLYNNTING